ncbi:MAG: hypothetical protein P8Y14_20535 [Anaerolineales bacterium]|jgi:hypothetical protein
MQKPSESGTWNFRSDLLRLLIKLGEAQFQELCNRLKVSRDELEPGDINRRAMSLIRYMEDRNLLRLLVNTCRDLAPDQSWPDPPVRERLSNGLTYYVASRLSDVEIRNRFRVKEGQSQAIHEITDNPEEADCLVFDLDQPPDDWLRFLGWQVHLKPNEKPPRWETIIFVRTQEPGAPKRVELDGQGIFQILNETEQYDFKMRMCTSLDDLALKLDTIHKDLTSRDIGNLPARLAAADDRIAK